MMKTRNIFYSVIVIFFTFFTISCSSHLVKNVNGLSVLEQKKQLFINKPLSHLIKEIKPAIKLSIPSFDSTKPSTFTFFFLDFDAYQEYERIHRDFPTRIRVVFKEHYSWNKNETRPTPRERAEWTKEDAKKYGNLTVIDIKVYEKK